MLFKERLAVYNIIGNEVSVSATCGVHKFHRYRLLSSFKPFSDCVQFSGVLFQTFET